MAGMVDQAVADGVEGEFGTVGDAELIEDIMQMIFGGLLGDKGFFVNLFVAEALGDELDDSLFAVAEQG